MKTSRCRARPITRLVEAFVHGEDIRRPLGIHHRLNTGMKFGGGKERVQGLRLVATDTDLSIGTGEDVRGTAIALLLAAYPDTR